MAREQESLIHDCNVDIEEAEQQFEAKKLAAAPDQRKVARLDRKLTVRRIVLESNRDYHEEALRQIEEEIERRARRRATLTPRINQ